MTESERVIGPGTSVTLHFALRLDDGEVIDSNFDKEPATFTVGDEQLLPGFEKALFGLKVGDTRTFRMAPEDGFGQHNPSNVQHMPRAQFGAELELQEGLVLSFADAQQTELPGVVREFDDQQVVVDFNHPLAGREIIFEVAVLRVEATQLH